MAVSILSPNEFFLQKANTVANMNILTSTKWDLSNDTVNIHFDFKANLCYKWVEMHRFSVLYVGHFVSLVMPFAHIYVNP